MRAKYVVIILGWLILAYPACQKKNQFNCLATPYPVKDDLGMVRNYKLYTWTTKESRPLLVYFHGVMSPEFKKKPVLRNYTGSPVEETGLIEFARRNHLNLLVPEPAYTYRFLDVTASGWSPFDKEINGIEKIIDTVLNHFAVDSKHVYLMGISAGAVLCHHLANRRPDIYNGILSHSQAYISEDNKLLYPAKEGTKFKVIFCYTRGDYQNLKFLCINSEKIYRQMGYDTKLLENLPPQSHRWSAESNSRFWRLLADLNRD